MRLRRSSSAQPAAAENLSGGKLLPSWRRFCRPPVPPGVPCWPAASTRGVAGGGGGFLFAAAPVRL